MTSVFDNARFSCTEKTITGGPEMPDDGPAVEPQCDGECSPDLATYHARCPLHGAPLWSLVLDIEASNADERAEKAND